MRVVVAIGGKALLQRGEPRRHGDRGRSGSASGTFGPRRDAELMGSLVLTGEECGCTVR